MLGWTITGRNINNFRYADDTTFKEESKELKSLLMKVKQESEKVGLKLSTSQNTGNKSKNKQMGPN